MLFSNILKRKREEKGLTQAEVAERIGTTQQNIASFESGYKVPSLKIVVHGHYTTNSRNEQPGSGLFVRRD